MTKWERRGKLLYLESIEITIWENKYIISMEAKFKTFTQISKNDLIFLQFSWINANPAKPSVCAVTSAQIFNLPWFNASYDFYLT